MAVRRKRSLPRHTPSRPSFQSDRPVQIPAPPGVLSSSEVGPQSSPVQEVLAVRPSATAAPGGLSSPQANPPHAPALGSAAANADAAGCSAENGRPVRGVLVVGMGDETRGDGGIGLHLVCCLAAMDWPGGVEFCQADLTVPARASHFAHVILLEAMEGPAEPGSLYRQDPEALLARNVGGAGSGMGLLTLLAPPVRRRLAIFGIHPGSTRWGSPLSAQVAGALPLLVPYLRAVILTAASRSAQVN